MLTPYPFPVTAGALAIVMHNGRLLLSPLPTNPETSSASEAEAGVGVASTPLSEPLHELDLVLLSSVERAKTAGTGIAALVTTTDETTQTTTKTAAAAVAVSGAREEDDAAADMYVKD